MLWYAKDYDPIQCGSIDGKGTEPHEKAIKRALDCNYRSPTHLGSDKYRTLFVGRLHLDTTEDRLEKHFSKFGQVTKVSLIRNKITGLSQGYGFVSFKSESCTRDAYHDANRTLLDGHTILVDYERDRLMKGWIPRRLGGGLGGKKESGQLRFGGRDRPFRAKSDPPLDHIKSDHWKYPSLPPKRRRQ
ncbi:hypothetical protein BY458DRAFT_497541 [Sporodiniella umbellata]|nr:hypothetical protein BY458DRAFT_497541 [Sporodiniella umbellata]